MPLYAYKCDVCKAEAQDVRKIDERHDGPRCHRCGAVMVLQVSPVAGIVKNPAVPRKS